MKKGIIFTILAAMILTFCGCGKQQTKDHSLKESSVSSSSEISQEEISADTESSVLPEQSSKQESKEKTVSSDESEASLEFVDFSGEAQDYTLEDKIKDYSEYMALQRRYGTAAAITRMENKLQKRIRDVRDLFRYNYCPPDLYSDEDNYLPKYPKTKEDKEKAGYHSCIAESEEEKK